MIIIETHKRQFPIFSRISKSPWDFDGDDENFFMVRNSMFGEIATSIIIQMVLMQLKSLTCCFCLTLNSGGCFCPGGGSRGEGGGKGGGRGGKGGLGLSSCCSVQYLVFEARHYS